MSARKGMNLKQAKYQLKSLEEAFERDATARHKNILNGLNQKQNRRKHE